MTFEVIEHVDRTDAIVEKLVRNARLKGLVFRPFHYLESALCTLRNCGRAAPFDDPAVHDDEYVA